MTMKQKKKAMPLPARFHEEVRKIRQGYKVSDKSSFSNSECAGSVVFECEICGELGDHICLPRMFAHIEHNQQMQEYCWAIYLKLAGVDEEEEGE